MKFYCGVKDRDVIINFNGVCLEEDGKCPKCSRKLAEVKARGY